MRQALVFLVSAGLAAHSFPVSAQDIPDALKDKALIVRVTAIVPAVVPDSGTTTTSLGSGTAPGSASETAPGTASGPTPGSTPGTVPGPASGSTPGTTSGTTPGAGASTSTGIDKGQPWEAESSKYTVPGTPVPFKLIGSNVAIIVQITPFERDDGKGVTLIAQGQVWVRPPQGGLSYHTTIESLSVDYGETVLFFPLGLNANGKSPIRLEISVVRASDADPESGGATDKTEK